MTDAGYMDPIDVEYTEFDSKQGVSKKNKGMGDNTNVRKNHEKGMNSVRGQIDCLDRELYPFGFTFMEITKASPRKKNDRYDCVDAIRTLINDQKMMGTMFQKGYLPIRLLSKQSEVPSKAIEAHEGYIIMASLVITGNYPDLQPYFDYVFDEE